MVEITVEQLNWLIKNKHLHWIPKRGDKPGKYDGLYVIGKGKPSKRKKIMLDGNIAVRLKIMEQEEQKQKKNNI